MERQYTAWGIMRLLLIAQIMIVLVGVVAAFAGPKDATWDPPARYNDTFKGRLSLSYDTPAAVHNKCKEEIRRHGIINPPTGTPFKGCSLASIDGSCDILVIDRPVGRTKPEDVIIHEIGHCNGWPAHHPN